MAIVKSLDWQIDANISIPASGSKNTDCRTHWLEWKRALTGFALAPFTVAGSSNSASAGMDGVDRWAALADVDAIASSGVHSWIVLQCPTTGMQIKLDLIVQNTSYWSAIGLGFSAGGLYTGGTTSVAPTAPDEQIVLVGGSAGNTWGTLYGNSSVDHVLHAWRSEGGEATLWGTCVGGYLQGFAYFGQLENSRHADLRFGALFANYGDLVTEALSFDNLFDQNTTSSAGNQFSVMRHRSYIGGLPVNGSAPAFMVAPSVNVNNTTTSGRRAAITEQMTYHSPSNNQILGEEECPSIGTYVYQTGDRGVHGRLYDVRWCGDHMAPGDTFPADGSRQWVKMGPLLLPWNGSVPVMA